MLYNERVQAKLDFCDEARSSWRPGLQPGRRHLSSQMVYTLAMAKSEPQHATAADQGGQWQNRITGRGDVDPFDLLANPKNWAIHPNKQKNALLAVLKQVGWVGSIMVNRRTGFVVDGHARVELALREKQRSVPVDYVELTDDEEDLILAAYDMITQGRKTDATRLDDLLAGLQIEDPDLQSFVDDYKSLGALKQVSFEADEDPEVCPCCGQKIRKKKSEDAQ